MKPLSTVSPVVIEDLLTFIPISYHEHEITKGNGNEMGKFVRKMYISRIKLWKMNFGKLDNTFPLGIRIQRSADM